MQEYKIYQIYLNVEYQVGIIESRLFYKNCYREYYQSNIKLPYFIANKDSIKDFDTPENFKEEDIRGIVEKDSFWKVLGTKKKIDETYPIKIIKFNFTYEEVDFSVRTLKYWKENLNTKDLLIMINQENLDVAELIS